MWEHLAAISLAASVALDEAVFHPADALCAVSYVQKLVFYKKLYLKMLCDIIIWRGNNFSTPIVTVHEIEIKLSQFRLFQVQIARLFRLDYKMM